MSLALEDVRTGTYTLEADDSYGSDTVEVEIVQQIRTPTPGAFEAGSVSLARFDTTDRRGRDAYNRGSPKSGVDRNRLVLGLAAVFAGLTVVLVVLAFVRQPFLLFLALPFAATTYLMWHHATGRIEERARREARASRAAGQRERRAPGGFGATARGARGAASGAGAGRRRATAPPDDAGPSRREAYETLGLDPGADEDAVRRAYRTKVKEVHPDAEGGDEEAFKRVNRAYERLRE